MRATGVIARFLSLLDVTLILLGVFMVILMHADVSRKTEKVPNPAGLAEIADVGFVYLYVGWRGDEKDRCYLLKSPGGELDREIRTDVRDDIEGVINTRERKNQAVLLLFDDDGWYSAWDDKKLADVEEAWGVKVLPITKVHLSHEENP